MYTFLHVTNYFIRVEAATGPCPANLLQHRQGTVQYFTLPCRTSADVIIYRSRSAPVGYVTTQKKILKNHLVLGLLSNLQVMCKSLKSYDVSFIGDHGITRKEFIIHFKDLHILRNNNGKI